MFPTNNPISLLVQAMNSEKDPMSLMQMMSGQNPQIAQAFQMMQGKNPQQLQTMAQNMAQERGIDLNQMIRQLGINNASYR